MNDSEVGDRSPNIKSYKGVEMHYLERPWVEVDQPVPKDFIVEIDEGSGK